MPNVALFIYGIGNLSGGGGAERFFADFYTKYQQHTSTSFKLFYILDKLSHSNLMNVNKLHTTTNILYFKIFSNRFKSILEKWQLFYYIWRYNIQLIHLPLYNVSYIPILNAIDKMPTRWRPKLVINISNCYVVPQLMDSTNPSHNSAKNTYFPLINQIKVDGYFSWYENFKSYIESSSIKNKPSLVYAISSRFSDTEKFYPMEKQNTVVFAARLDEQKHPEWFLQAIHLLKINHAQLVQSWKFILCGNGPLRDSLIETAKQLGLEEMVEFKIEGELQKILNHSKIYVSCQDFENFPSLSMAEAMAAGNAVIARNVGQTRYFLEESKNGIFINPDNALGLAAALQQIIESPEMLNNMGKHSEELMKTKHTFSNFVPQIEMFWEKLINAKN